MNSSTSSRPTAPEKPENGASVGKLDGGQVPLTPGLAVLRVPDNVLHLWPDPGLETKQTPDDVRNWLQRQWAKKSAWPL